MPWKRAELVASMEDSLIVLRMLGFSLLKAALVGEDSQHVVDGLTRKG